MDDGTDWLILIIGIVLGLGILYLAVLCTAIRADVHELIRRARLPGTNRPPKGNPEP